MLYWVKKWWREYHFKFVYCLEDIRFKPFNMINIQLAGAYISKEMTDPVSASHIPFSNKSQKANGMSVCINTWWSWLFIPYNLHSSLLTSLDMFEACLLEKHRLLSPLWTSSYAFFSNMKLALGFATCDPSQTNSIFLRLQDNAKSNLALMLSFIFPFTSMTMLKMFSNMFFSMCMTSRLWRRRLVFQ